MSVRSQPTDSAEIQRRLLGAVTAHKAGRLEDAKQLYLAVLAVDVKHAKSLYGIGLIAHQAGNLDVAARMIERAVACTPQVDAYHASLAAVLREQGRSDPAQAACHAALSLNPDNEEAHFILAEILRELGKLAEAEQHYNRALALRPDCSETWQNLGMVLRRMGRIEEAMEALKRALAINPGNVAALHNLGNLLVLAGDLSAARTFFDKAITLEPDLAEAHNGLGAVLQENGELDAAEQCYQRALELKPDYAEAHCNIGNLARRRGHLEQAKAQYERAIGLLPGLAEAHSNLGLIAQSHGKLIEARAHYDRAIELDPASADARWNRCLLDLLEGNLAAGWKDYEVRYARRQSAPRTVPGPLWRGEPLQGAPILLYSEQGLGDTLQFIRYVPLVAGAGGRVILDVPGPLRRLAEQLGGISVRTAEQEPSPKSAWQCPLMGLPYAFGTTGETIPAEVPYLAVPPEAQDAAEKLDWPRDGLRVGIVWSGNPKHLEDRYRSIPLPLWKPLLEVEGVRFFSLQLGAGAQLAAIGSRIVDLEGAIQDLADTAALILHLDLVISVDTSVAHLAGALAKPVWVLLPFAPDWRWLTGRQDSPWYPTMRLFRQPGILEWTPVLERVGSELAELARAGRRLPPPP
jgi:tetratricopeptide (TPR) repeat protein